MICTSNTESVQADVAQPVKLSSGPEAVGVLLVRL